MESWSCPKSLQLLSSRVIVKNFLDENAFPTSMDDTHRVIQLFETQLIPSIYKWWESFPNLLKKLLQPNIHAVTEGNLHHMTEHHSYKRIFYFILKIVTLDKVIYGESANITRANCEWKTTNLSLQEEEVLVAVTKVCCNLPMRRLVLIGKLSNRIVEDVFENAPNLEVLSVSRPNFNYDFLIILRNKCNNLRELYLPTTEDGSYKKSPPFDELLKNMFLVDFFDPGVPALEYFPKLRILDLGTFANFACCIALHQVNNEFSRLIFHSGSRWNPAANMEKYLRHFLLNEGKDIFFSGTKLTLSCEFLLSLTDSQITNFRRAIPNCVYIVITFEDFNRDFSSIKINSSLSAFLRSFDLSISIIHGSKVTTERFLSATLPVIGQNIISMDICVHSIQYRGFSVNNLQDVLKYCPSLIKLKLVITTLRELDIEPIFDENFSFQSNKIRELCLWNSEPTLCQNCTNVDLSNYIAESALRWIKFINLFQASSTELDIFYTNVFDSASVSKVLDKFISNAHTFYFQYNYNHHAFINEPHDNCNYWPDLPITFDHLKMVIERFPNLRILHLKGVEVSVFWKLKKYFSYTGLQIFWQDSNNLSHLSYQVN